MARETHAGYASKVGDLIKLLVNIVDPEFDVVISSDDAQVIYTLEVAVERSNGL